MSQQHCQIIGRITEYTVAIGKASNTLSEQSTVTIEGTVCHSSIFGPEGEKGITVIEFCPKSELNQYTRERGSEIIIGDLSFEWNGENDYLTTITVVACDHDILKFSYLKNEAIKVTPKLFNVASNEEIVEELKNEGCVCLPIRSINFEQAELWELSPGEILHLNPVKDTSDK